MKNLFIGLGIFVGLLSIVFILELFGLGMFKFFAPKKENIRREVFEQTKSYVHGVIQDLGKYYSEYQKTTSEDRQIIQATIQMRFAEFDADKIEPVQLRNFLINMRGY